MSEAETFDLFLSHGSPDKAVGAGDEVAQRRVELGARPDSVRFPGPEAVAFIPFEANGA